MGCVELINVEIPNSVNEIGNRVFNGCTKLISIEIPKSIEKIMDCAFNSFHLTEIHILKDNPDDIKIISGQNNMTAIRRLKTITLYVPIGTGYAYRHHPFFGQFKEIITERYKAEESD